MCEVKLTDLSIWVNVDKGFAERLCWRVRASVTTGNNQS